RGPVVLDEVDHVGTELRTHPPHRADEPRKADRLAQIVVRAREVIVAQVHALVRSEVDRDRTDSNDRQSIVRNVLDHRGYDLKLMAEALEDAEDVQPDVIVPRGKQRNDSKITL